MAEIGLIASVIQVAGAGLKLSQTLYQYADTVASADRRIKDIAKEVELTSFVIDELGHVFRQDESSVLLSKNAVKTANETVRECSTIFGELDSALKKSQKNKLGRFMLPFRESKIGLLRDHIDKLKSTLQLLMQVLTHAHQVASQKLDREAEAAQREQIKALLQNKKDSARKYEESLRNYQMHEEDADSDKENQVEDSARSLAMTASSIASTITTKSLETCVQHIQSLMDDLETLQKVLSTDDEGRDQSEHQESLIESYFRARTHLDGVLLGNPRSFKDSIDTGVHQLAAKLKGQTDKGITILKTLSGSTLQASSSRTSEEIDVRLNVDEIGRTGQLWSEAEVRKAILEAQESARQEERARIEQQTKTQTAPAIETKIPITLVGSKYPNHLKDGINNDVSEHNEKDAGNIALVVRSDHEDANSPSGMPPLAPPVPLGSPFASNEDGSSLADDSEFSSKKREHYRGKNVQPAQGRSIAAMPLTPQETLKPQPLSMEKLLRQDGDQHELWPGTKKHENLEMVVTHRRPSSANTRPSLLPRASSSYSVRRPAPLLEPSSGTSNQSRPPQLSARYSSHRPGRYTQAEVGYQSSGYSSSEDEEEAEYDEERQKAPRKLLSPPRKAPPPGTRRNHGLHRTQPQRRSSLNRVSVHNTTRLDHGNIPNDRIEPRDLMSSPSGFSSRMTRDRVPDVYFTQQRLGAPQSRHRSENGGVKPRRDSVSEQFLGAKYLKRNPEARKRLGVENELAFVREMLKTNRLKRSSQKAFHMRETELEAATVQMRSQNMLRMLQKRDIEPRNGRASRDLDPPSRHRQDSTSSISQGSGSVLHLPGGVKIHIDDRKQAYSVERTLARNQEGREISELRRVQRGDNKRLRASLDTTYPPSDSRSQRSRRTSSQYSQISVDVNGRRRGHMYHPQSNRWVREAMSDKDSREQWEDEWYSGGKKRPSRVNNIEDTEEENLSHLSQSQLSDLESPEERDVYDQRRHLRTRPGERVKKLDRQQAPSIRVSSVDSPPGRPRRPHSYHSSVPSTHDAPLGMSVYYRGASPPASLAHHGSPLTHPFHSNSSGYTHPAYPQANPFYSSGPGYEHMRFGSGYPPSQPFYPPSAPPPLYASSPPQKKATPAPAPSSALTHVSAASHDYNHVDNDAHGYTHSRGNGSDHWQHQRVKEQLTDVEEQHDKRILADKELATQLKALEGERTREEDEARIKAEEERLKQDWGSNSKAEKRKAAKAPRATPAEADERLVRLEKLLLGKQEEDSTIEETAEQRLREEKLPLAKQEYAAKIENAERRAKASAEQAAKKSMEDEYHAKSLEYLRAEKETVQKRQSRSEAHRSAEAAERRLLAEAEAKRAKSGKDKAITNTRTEALPARISGATKHSSDDPSAETPESSEGEDAPHLGNTGSFSDHPRNESNVESTQKHPTTFQCPKCPKRFTKAYMLRTHVRQHARISHELDEGQDGHTPGDIRGQYQAWSTVDVASPPTDAPAMLAPTAEAASSSVFPTGGLRGSANASPLVGVVEAVGEPSERPTAPVEDSRASLSRLTSLAPWQLEAFPDELPPDPVSRPSAPHPETPAHDEELLKEKELHVEKDTDDDEAEDDPDEPHGKLSAGTAAQFLMAASESEGSEDVEAPAKELGVLTMPTSSTGPWLPTGVEVVRGHVESSEEYDDDDGEDGITEDDDSKPPQIPQSTIAPWVSQRAPPVSVLPQALKESSEEDESDEEAADQEEGRKEINNPRIPSAVVQDYDESDDDDNLRQTFQNRRTLDLAPGHARRPVATASANPSLQQQMLSLPQRLELGTTTAKEYIPRPVSIAIADYEESEVDEDSDGEENDEDKEVNDLLREWTTVLD